MALHNINKQKNNEDTTDVLSVQPTQTVLFLYCPVFPLFCPSPGIQYFFLTYNWVNSYPSIIYQLIAMTDNKNEMLKKVG